MAEISLYLTNVNVSLGQNMDIDKSPGAVKDFESVELGDLGRREGALKEKAPRRIIHFSSGETMEEYSTDEEEESEEKEPEKKDLLSAADASKMNWGPYVWFHMWKAATSTISACDYLGERMASLFGITSAKYQYAIDEYYRMKKEKEEDDVDNRLSEEAERYFDERRCREEDPDEAMTTGQVTPEVTAPQAEEVACEIESEPQAAAPAAVPVPAVVAAT